LLPEGAISQPTRQVREPDAITGNNTYQIVYTGNSDVAMDGAAISEEDSSSSL